MLFLMTFDCKFCMFSDLVTEKITDLFTGELTLSFAQNRKSTVLDCVFDRSVVFDAVGLDDGESSFEAHFERVDF